MCAFVRAIQRHETKPIGATMLLQWSRHARRGMDWREMVHSDS